ncbi:hypothetical protein NM688_g4234 [Phlebia brevispora]|uniref:Uncharacterized protein n=1 Tax=Phlebia brevispora TaxID=194682 RepID=A0ACC1T3P3_9APHY|nr:hypothetical protein NM688_g4234 [Phlebia brevispora]
MSSTSLLDVLSAYPEKSAFDWDPLIHNLAPEDQSKDSKDTPEFLAGALVQAKKDGMNPLWRWYGTNPVAIFDRKLQKADLPITAYTTPPPLPELDISAGVTVIEQLHPTGTTPMFKVQIGDDMRMMKVFMDADPDEVHHPDPDMPWIAMVRFRREKEAYAHLLHYGACQKGVVPMCYGWAELPFPLVDELSARFGKTERDCEQVSRDIARLKNLLRPPKAIFLELIEDVVPLSLSNVSTKVAEAALRALCTVHACYVKHNDIARRNILVVKKKRILWVDFDSAYCVSLRKTDRVKRQDLLDELATAWSFFYADLLPDKRIGFNHWLY